LVENRDLFTPLAFDAPVRGVPVGILPSRLVWDTIPTCDRWTDGRTDILPCIVRAMHTRRAVKMLYYMSLCYGLYTLLYK